MRKIFLPLIMMLVAMAANAAGYTVSQVQNVHVADSTRFVTNPDGVLSPAAESQLNGMLRSLMAKSSAEVFVVAVNDIDSDADIEDFSTELFRKWGVGKKDVNNGLLVLIVKDRRQATFRTGNGVEGLLPDGYLGTLMREKMTPRYKQGDYDGGTVAMMSEITNVLSSPEALEEVRSKYANNSRKSEGDSFVYFIYFSILLAAGSLVWVLVVAAKSGKKSRFDRYQAANKLFWPVVTITILGLGIPLISFLIVYFWRRDMRYGKHICPDCGTQMQLVDEVHDNDYLNREQDLEERLGTVDYDVWLCPKCGETEIIPYEQKATSFTQCPVCHARALRVVSDRTVKQPTPTATGLRVVTSRCASCGFEDSKTHVLAKVATAPVLPFIFLGGGGGGPFGGGGGGFGGGSMGGGTTSGGGATGSW